MKNFKLKTPLVSLIAVLGASISVSGHAASFSVGDLVSSPTHVNGFEGVSSSYYEPHQASYTEDGITVSQSGDNHGGVSTTWGNAHLGMPGQYSWYATGGDNGYTSITLADGSDFGDVSLITGSGWDRYHNTEVYLNYSLWNSGAEVLAGSILQSLLLFPVSFTGGGFDTILLSATLEENHPLSGAYQGLIIDQIEVSGVSNVPVPAAVWLFGSGLLGLMGASRRKTVQA